jgi:hypothetical protein
VFRRQYAATPTAIREAARRGGAVAAAEPPEMECSAADR